MRHHPRFQIPAAVAGLQLCFSQPGACFASACLVIFQTDWQAVGGGGHFARLMLADASLQIGRRADVKLAVAASQNVSIGEHLCPFEPMPAALREALWALCDPPLAGMVLEKMVRDTGFEPVTPTVSR